MEECPSRKGIRWHAIRALKQRPGDLLRAIGIISLGRRMGQVGLVDRQRLKVFPVIPGAAGRAPTYAGYGRLELIEARVLDFRLILLGYRPALV